MNKDQEMLKSVEVKAPWFNLKVDDIDWKTVIVVAMVLAAIVYIVKG